MIIEIIAHGFGTKSLIDYERIQRQLHGSLIAINLSWGIDFREFGSYFKRMIRTEMIFVSKQPQRNGFSNDYDYDFTTVSIEKIELDLKLSMIKGGKDVIYSYVKQQMNNLTILDLQKWSLSQVIHVFAIQCKLKSEEIDVFLDKKVKLDAHEGQS